MEGKRMIATFSRQGGYFLFFRACVALRRLLAARRRPIVRQVRKVAILGGLWFSTTGGLAVEPVDDSNHRSSPSAGAAIDVSVQPIGRIGASIAPPPGELPTDAARQHFAEAAAYESPLTRHDWLAYAYFWEAPAIFYHPLYFEEPRVERFGVNAGCILQPVISGAHFFTSIPALPVKMALDRPCTDVYSLGFARPGSETKRVR
jgi:hypothetical protein